MSETSERDAYCQPAPKWRHSAIWVSGKRPGLTAICQHCGERIRRANRRSAWWWTDVVNTIARKL